MVTLNFSNSDKISAAIKCFVANINKLSGLKRSSSHLIDLANLNWATPLEVLPIAAILKKKEDEGFKFEIKNFNSRGASYLNKMHFYDGDGTEKDLLRHKNYLPIISISESEGPQRINHIGSCILDILVEKVQCKKNINAYGYAFTEMFGNIWQHSKTCSGWFFAQYYPSKKFVDICFLDTGIGIKKSYTNLSLKSDTDAIEAALAGKTSKAGEERGYGIWTTEKLVTKSDLSGSFLIITGNAAYFSDNKNKIPLLLDCNWKGTIVWLRIHKTAKKIDINEYVE